MTEKPEIDDWNEHWEATAKANESNPAQDFRRRLCVAVVGRHGPVQRLLDIGSGLGQFIDAAHRRWPAAQLLGIEMAETGVAMSRELVPSARFEVVDLIEKPEPLDGAAAWATHAVCSEVLEHVDDPSLLMANARAWLAPGAVVVVTVPGGPMSAFDRHIGHRQHFSGRELRVVLEDAGYHVHSSTGSGFPFFNLYRLLVIARGERLVEEATTHGTDEGSRVIALGMKAFDPLLRISGFRSPLGWQTVAVATVPPR